MEKVIQIFPIQILVSHHHYIPVCAETKLYYDIIYTTIKVVLKHEKPRPNSIPQDNCICLICTWNDTVLLILGQGRPDNELAEARGESSQTVTLSPFNKEVLWLSMSLNVIHTSIPGKDTNETEILYYLLYCFRMFYKIVISHKQIFSPRFFAEKHSAIITKNTH